MSFSKYIIRRQNILMDNFDIKYDTRIRTLFSFSSFKQGNVCAVELA